jgi:hypothetical protein
MGVAVLTPVLFTPIGGTILANSFGETRKRIIFYMFVSSIVWGFALSILLSFFSGIAKHFGVH